MLSSVLWMWGMINVVSISGLMPTCIQLWADTAWNLYFLYVEHCHVRKIWSVLLVVLCMEKKQCCVCWWSGAKMHLTSYGLSKELFFYLSAEFCSVHWIWSVLGLLMVGCINVCNHWQTQHRICVCMLNFARKCLTENNLMMKLYIRIFDGAFI